uniref:Uncharacterized protein n=1 Tax=Lepisosteus oculatus TaxID=7918 RepID=W5NFN9_LEPOC
MISCRLDQKPSVIGGRGCAGKVLGNIAVGYKTQGFVYTVSLTYPLQSWSRRKYKFQNSSYWKMSRQRVP